MIFQSRQQTDKNIPSRFRMVQRMPGWHIRNNSLKRKGATVPLVLCCLSMAMLFLLSSLFLFSLMLFLWPLLCEIYTTLPLTAKDHHSLLLSYSFFFGKRKGSTYPPFFMGMWKNKNTMFMFFFHFNAFI